MKISKVHLAILSLIIANTIWGAAAPIFKWSLQGIEPFTLAFLRFLIAALIILPFTLHKFLIKKEDWALLFTISILGMAFHIAYLFMGLQLTSSINALIIGSAGPVFIIFGSVIFLHEKPSKKILKGTTISLIGIVLIILRPLFEQGLSNSVIGNLFFIVSVILMVIYTLLLKKLAPKYSPLTLTFWIFAITAISFAPLVLYEVNQNATPLYLDQKAVIGILFGGILSSCVAYLLHTFAIKYISANEVGIFHYVDPIIGVIMANMLLGESITRTFLFGSFLIFLGIFVSEGRIHYHPIHLFFKKRSPDPSTPALILSENSEVVKPDKELSYRVTGKSAL